MQHMSSVRFCASAFAVLALLPYCSAQLSFNAPQTIATGFHDLSGFAVGDFNGDNKPDLAFTDSFDKRIIVYLNNGIGGFAAPISTYLSIPNTAGSLAVGDVNEDGKQDLIVATIAGPQVSLILLGKGDGTFTMSGSLPDSFGFTAGKLVDLNGDKHLDFIAASDVWLSDGKGNFTKQAASLQLNGALLYTSLIVADFNRDGKVDVIESSNHTVNSPATEGDIEFFTGNGDGTFGSPTTLRPFNVDTYDFLGFADFNGDGKLDFAFSHPSQAAISLGNGDGTFQATSKQLIYPPQGGSPETFPTPAARNAVAVADFDGNGTPDIAIVNAWLRGIFVSLNDGTGTFPQANADFQANIDADTFFVLTADLNGDGLPDLITGSYTTNNVQIFLSKRVRTTPTVTLASSATQTIPGTAITLSAKVTGTRAVPTGNITFADGTTSLGQVALDANGQATFTTSSLAAGQHSLTATYAGDATFNRAASAAVTESVVDFALSLGTASQSIAAGGSATYNVTLTGTAGLTGAVTLTCTGLPAGYACTGSAASLGAQPTAATITVAPSTHAIETPLTNPFGVSSGITLAVLPFGVWLTLSRKRRWSGAGIFYALVLTTGSVWLSGCSGSSSPSSSSSSGSSSGSTTYHGTSNFTVNAAVQVGTQTLSHQTTATLTVQ